MIAVVAEKVAKLQHEHGSLTIISYEDENPDLMKAKLIRGKCGVDANVDFLKITAEVKFGRKHVEFSLDEVVKINSLKFKNSIEQQAWKDVHRKRWMNLLKVVQQAMGKQKRPKWVGKVLPWLNTDEGSAAAGEQQAVDDEDRMG